MPALASRPVIAVVAALVPACVGSPVQVVQETYFKASNAELGDDFGRSIALSADGTTLAVGAPREDGAASGINQSEDNLVAGMNIGSLGAVYVFVHQDGRWHQEAYIKASNPEVDDWFGSSLAVSSDGNTLAVGAPGEDSGSSTNQNSNTTQSSGAVYVFTRQEGRWNQVAYVKSSRPVEEDRFGSSVALSGEGSILAVGAPASLDSFGAVHVFTRDSAMWTPKQVLSTPDVESPGSFGWSVALSLDGRTLAAGAPREGEPGANSSAGAGAVYVFARTSEAWSRPQRLVSEHAGAADNFGEALAVSGDGSTLAVGSPREPNATDDPTGDVRAGRGAVYVFSRGSATWNAEDRIALSSTDASDFFGLGVALSADGSRLAVGAPVEPSSAGQDPPDVCADDLGGIVHVLAKAGATWSSRTRIKGSNTCMHDHFGLAVGLSTDGSVLAVGANGEDSASHGVDQDRNDNSAGDAGAAYVLR